MVETMQVWLDEIPGGPGIFLIPVLSVAPWLIFLLVAVVPVLRVRARRHKIVLAVDRDLPMALALLATLAESGLGLDAAIERVLGALPPERPLAQELRRFRAETQAGLTRVECFRRLDRRLDMVSVSIFVSAILHAEDVGSGIAESLRRQADEVWNRRRELALQKAQSLPTKLAVPLVVCFLPGIFVYTFGPALAQFLEIAEGSCAVSGNPPTTMSRLLPAVILVALCVSSCLSPDPGVEREPDAELRAMLTALRDVRGGEFDRTTRGPGDGPDEGPLVRELRALAFKHPQHVPTLVANAALAYEQGDSVARSATSTRRSRPNRPPARDGSSACASPRRRAACSTRSA